ncbi:MAG TPA: VanW family protein, partial [Candidatus Limnocylindrales bacterium]|nr:VanW family protein [Candidatus Limnocylindrales bacterium]
DASITRADGRYVVSPSSDGTAVDMAQVVQLAMDAINNTSATSAQIVVEGTPVLPTVTTEQAQAAVDRAERTVAGGLTLSGEELSTTISSDILRGWVHLDEVAVGQWQLSIEAGPIAQFLAAYAAETDVAPTNASFSFAGGVDQVTVVPSAAGRSLDVEASTANVLAVLQARADSQDPGSASLALFSVEPDLDTADAQALAGRITMLGTWTTNYTPQVSNGQGVNIQIPTSAVDGYVVQPNEEFDFLTAIGPITSPPYVSGGVLIHGQIREDGAIGGGMCSCSTTLFNAAMRAGLQIDARGNHSIYISRYPVGLDATVWMSGGQRRTMAFTNDTGYPVLIKGINRPGKVVFELYGIDDGRTVELSEPRVENVVQAEAWFQYTDELPPGRREFKQDRYHSFDSWVTRTVRDAAGNVIHEDTFFSHYKKLDAITLVGRYPSDPPAGTRIHPDQYRAPDDPNPTPTPDPGSLVANFTYSRDGDGTRVTFINTSSEDALSFAWTFGDGEGADNKNPTHTYADFGTYRVTVTVTDADGNTATRSKRIEIAAPTTEESPSPTPPAG